MSQKITFRLPDDYTKFMNEMKKKYRCSTTTFMIMAIRGWYTEYSLFHNELPFDDSLIRDLGYHKESGTQAMLKWNDYKLDTDNY